ncbi:hypothetical protein O181_001320 [Austropuccinia psidii MF-1]|uniref:Uncharacterized protein n=1 Tax=Austropuccinia psidii MF-1 TaxID=1389203 RepID=A0A9Q3GBQ4_9BASI|nr:hypothetical protein [Austropuccinia psidii MF-1]
MFQRGVHLCTRGLTDKDKNWQNMEKLDIKSPNNLFLKKEKQKAPFKPNTSNTHEQREAHKCGGIGPLANNCLKKAKINETVETENQNDKEEESESDRDTEK